MTKFSNRRSNITSVIGTTDNQAYTYEGSPGYTRDAKSELFLLAVNNLVSEKTFYEDANSRDKRFANLIHRVTQDDPDWVLAFIPYLRDVMGMRSASIVVAAEYVKAGGKNGRQAVSSAMSRADEPGEMLGYWTSEYGRAIPKPIKRGISDAAQRLFTEKAALKYDGQNNSWRLADVIDLCHVIPASPKQSNLYRWLLDRRHNRENIIVPESLQMIQNYEALMAVPVEERRNYLNPATLRGAGFTWEMLSGWLQGPMDAQAWEAVIPNMGYMAQLRNLRNFEEKDVSFELLNVVEQKITDPAEVAASRQFPFRFYSAYKYSQTGRFEKALARALELSTQNVPILGGNTLILQDISGSMTARISEKSEITLSEIGAVFGATLVQKSNNCDWVLFASSNKRFDPTGRNVLRTVKELTSQIGSVGYGTEMFPALATHYRPGYHNRVIIISDMQTFDSYHRGIVSQVTCPIYNFVLGGYAVSAMETGSHGRYDLGGLTDNTFVLMQQLEKGRNVGWDFIKEQTLARKELVEAKV